MSAATFFPNNPIALSFVLVLIVWFVSWILRLGKESAFLARVRASMTILEGTIEPLRAQLLWRDRQRLKGNDAGIDPGLFYDQSVRAQFEERHAPLPAAPVYTHFKSIFVAGCDESLLDSPELTHSTLNEIGRSSDQLRLELLMALLFGAVGTLLALSRLSSIRYEAGNGLSGALPPAIWGTLLSLVGGVIFLRFNALQRTPCFFDLRRKTLTVWIPKLYPTVAQRAAQWAVQTLQNAARVTDASEVIETRTIQFVNSVENARKAGETFAEGMRQFSHGIQASDMAIARAQAKLAEQINLFAESFRRWTSFEEEIRSFYRAVEKHQLHLAEEQKTLQYMLSSYHDLMRQATSTLEHSAAQVSSATSELPQAFHTSADRMTRTAAEFQNSVAVLLANLASELKANSREDSVELHQHLDTALQPIKNMEKRLRALGEPFDRAANNLLEVATNLWKLNDSLAKQVSSFLSEQQQRELLSRTAQK